MVDCRVCGSELTDENWNPSLQKINSKICKKCHTKESTEWRQKCPEKIKKYKIKQKGEYHNSAIVTERRRVCKIYHFFKNLWDNTEVPKMPQTTCIKCGVELVEENWNYARRKANYHICKECDAQRYKNYNYPENKEQVQEYYRNYYQKNKDKLKNYHRAYYKNNNFRHRLPHIKEKAKRKYREDIAENRDKYLEAWAKRKGRGFIPLNEYFDGADGHHIDKEHVIFMPMVVHRSIPHDERDPDSMWTINCMALLWLIYGSLPEVEMKLPDWIFKPLSNEKYKQLTLF